MADFEHLFSVLVDNHPFLALKARVEGYEWASHHDEFASVVRQTKNNAEFAVAIKTILSYINNGHTAVADPLVTTCVPRPEVIDEAYWALWEAQYAGIDPEVAERWWKLSNKESDGAKDTMTCVYALYSSGRYVVVGASPSLRDKVDILSGLHVETVNGQDVHAYVASLRGTEWLKYDPIRKRLYQSSLPLPRDQVDIGLATPDGDATEIRSPGLTAPYSMVYSRPPFLNSAMMKAPNARTEGSLCGCILGGDVGYLRVPGMTLWSLTEVLAKETSMLKDFFHEIKDLPALIIDIRGNGGGQDLAWYRLVSLLASEEVRMDFAHVMRRGDLVRPFADYLEKTMGTDSILDCDLTGLPPEVTSDAYRDPVRSTMSFVPDPESVHYRGKVFLLVDDRVYSSAENFAAFCKGSGWATLVGEPTGGDGLGFNLIIHRLPNSGLVVKFPMALGLNPDMTANEEMHTMPDILVEPSIEDLMKAAYWRPSGQPDPATDAVLRRCLELARSNSMAEGDPNGR